MHEICEVLEQEVRWIYFHILNNHPGKPISQQDMGYDLHGLMQALNKITLIDHSTFEKTVISRAVALTILISRGRFFKKSNHKIARLTGLHMLKKNGFTIKAQPTGPISFTKTAIEEWFHSIASLTTPRKGPA